MVSGIIIGNQHKDSCLVFRIAQAIVMHGTVATAVTKRQNRYLAYLLTDLQHLVGLQILDDEFIGADEVLFLRYPAWKSGVSHPFL